MDSCKTPYSNKQIWLINFNHAKHLNHLEKNKATGDLIIKNANKLITQGKFDGENEVSRFIKVFDTLLNEQIKNILN